MDMTKSTWAACTRILLTQCVAGIETNIKGVRTMSAGLDLPLATERMLTEDIFDILER